MNHSVIFDCFLRLVNPNSSKSNKENHFLIIEYQETHQAIDICRFIHYIFAVFINFMTNISQHFQVHFIIVYGPNVEIGPPIYDYGSVILHIVYLKDFNKKKLFKLLNEKVLNGQLASELELLALAMLPRHSKFDINLLTECIKYLSNMKLMDENQSGCLYYHYKSFFKDHVPADYWNTFEEEHQLDHYRDLYLDELERQAHKEGLAEAAISLLDDGVARDVILRTVAKTADAWLRSIEATRRAKKAG